MVRVFKVDAEIRNACICGAALVQTRRLLPRIGHFLLNMWKASSEEHWFCMK